MRGTIQGTHTRRSWLGSALFIVGTLTLVGGPLLGAAVSVARTAPCPGGGVSFPGPVLECTGLSCATGSCDEYTTTGGGHTRKFCSCDGIESRCCHVMILDGAAQLQGNCTGQGSCPSGTCDTTEIGGIVYPICN